MRPATETSTATPPANRSEREFYQACTSNDGKTWVRGGVWTHDLQPDAKIGLISMGGAGFHAWFDYVRVCTVRHDTREKVIS